jgi:hypothetical protein
MVAYGPNHIGWIATEFLTTFAGSADDRFCLVFRSA